MRKKWKEIKSDKTWSIFKIMSEFVEGFEKLDDCELAKVDIVAEPKLQDKHKIVIVPTIVIFKDVEETWAKFPNF